MLEQQTMMFQDPHVDHVKQKTMKHNEQYWKDQWKISFFINKVAKHSITSHSCWWMWSLSTPGTPWTQEGWPQVACWNRKKQTAPLPGSCKKGNRPSGVVFQSFHNDCYLFCGGGGTQRWQTLGSTQVAHPPSCVFLLVHSCWWLSFCMRLPPFIEFWSTSHLRQFRHLWRESSPHTTLTPPPFAFTFALNPPKSPYQSHQQVAAKKRKPQHTPRRTDTGLPGSWDGSSAGSPWPSVHPRPEDSSEASRHGPRGIAPVVRLLRPMAIGWHRCGLDVLDHEFLKATKRNKNTGHVLSGPALVRNLLHSPLQRARVGRKMSNKTEPKRIVGRSSGESIVSSWGSPWCHTKETQTFSWKF